MKNNTFKEYILPVIVLVMICLVATGVLAMTYGVTNPIIQKNAKATADKNRKELLADATGFKKYTGKLITDRTGKASVSEAYTATNGAGAVMTIVTKSFGGDLTMMVGVNKSGAITGIRITDHSDTPGVGTKNMTTKYLGQYKSIKKLTSSNVKEETQISYISGASVTGQALQRGVECALSQFAKMGGAK